MRRNKRRIIIEHRIKEVLSLEKELQVISNAESELGYIVLDKPIRDGWFRTFKLRSDILKQKQASVYQEVLDAIVVDIWGREKKYADKNWKKHFKRSDVYYQRPGIRYLSEKEFMKLTKKARSHFIHMNIKTYSRYQKVYLCDLPKYYFQDAYRRAYITRRNITSPELESRRQEIYEILNRNELYKFSNSYSVYNWDNSNKKMRLRSKIELLNLLEEQFSV